MNTLEARREHGRFVKGGQRGPGRPPGLRNRLHQELDDMPKERVVAIQEMILAKAERGDLEAAKIILARAWPVPKGRTVRFTLRNIQSITDVPGALDDIRQAAANGDITLEEAAQFFRFVGQSQTAFELMELKRRLDYIEEVGDLNERATR